MLQRKPDLRDPTTAVILAFLVPGLGHFYQRRVFKGVLYAVCILGTFFTGLRIGHGQVVYFHWKQPENRTYAYLCQFWVGIPALPALAQVRRARDLFDANYVPNTVSSDFSGTLSDYTDGTEIGKVTGKITLRPEKPDNANYWVGTLDGALVTPDGTKKKIKGDVQKSGGWLEAQVAPWRNRAIRSQFKARLDGKDETITYRLEGSLPRAIWDFYEAPLQDQRANELAGESSDLDRAHKELGGRFELGVLYTMIAGLLNILAMYDAYEGPAYEDEEDESKSDRPPPPPPPPPAG
jgi:hypothetical protein